jgi:hypothetical protein
MIDQDPTLLDEWCARIPLYTLQANKYLENLGAVNR